MRQQIPASRKRPLPPPGIPPAEVEITQELVEQLLADQHRDLVDGYLRLFGSGWDNTTYRLGDDLAVRMPRRDLGAKMMLKEQRWLPQLAGRLSLPIGRPIRTGEPGHGYPWTWSIVEWIEGISAEVEGPDPSQAAPLGAFLRELHTVAPPEAPLNAWRGIPLADRRASVDQRLERIDEIDLGVPVAEVAQVWNRVVEVPIDLDDRYWLHGDLHPRNIIVAEGEIRAVIDWGDLCAGDPATDLAAAWTLFPNEVHEDFRNAYGNISHDTWERALGWAIFFGVVMVDAGRIDDAAWAVRGREALRRVCA